MTKKQKSLFNFSAINDQMMVTAAHRYCLGRRSYVVGMCIDWLKANWQQIELNGQNIILRDTIEALQDNNAGSEMDSENWKHFCKWIWSRLSEESKVWVVNSIMHREKPFPFEIDSQKESMTVNEYLDRNAINTQNRQKERSKIKS